MISVREYKKQKGFLKITFMVVFAISFMLVIFENIKINKENHQFPTKNNLTSVVRGKSTNRKKEITEYSFIVKESLIAINENIDFILNDKTILIPQIRKIYNNLLLASVPVIFQDLHLDLINITKEMLKSDQLDKNYLIEQKTNLFKEYPWLSKVIQED